MAQPADAVKEVEVRMVTGRRSYVLRLEAPAAEQVFALEVASGRHKGRYYQTGETDAQGRPVLRARLQ